ncbi:MAG TPA: hotdog domain-containing protein [Anaerolineaceae bacterium]
MAIAFSTIQHLIKSEDLNHHRTLYAGRTAEWFVETGFIAAANLIPPENVVCMKIHGMEFLHPVLAGEIAHFEGRVVYAGRSSLIAHVNMRVKDRPIVEGFITFIHVDANGNPAPHGIVIEPANDEERALYEQARRLKSLQKV